MPEHSKVAEDIRLAPMLRDLLIGNNRRRLVSATVLLIIAFLIHVKNKRPDYEPLREKVVHGEAGKRKKVKMDVFRVEKVMSMLFFGQGSKNWFVLSFLTGTVLRWETYCY